MKIIILKRLDCNAFSEPIVGRLDAGKRVVRYVELGLRCKLFCQQNQTYRAVLFPVSVPIRVRTMAMANAIAEAMKAATMFSLRATATRAGPAI